MNIIKITLIALMMITLIACSGNDAPNAGQEGLLNKSTTLEGTWGYTCQALSKTGPAFQVLISSLPQMPYATSNGTYQGNTLTTQTSIYTDSTCTNLLSDSVAAQSTSTATFVIGNTVTTDSGLTATEIDVTPVVENSAVVFTTYSIFSIDGNTLYQGLHDPAVAAISADKRISKLNFDLPYTKQ